MNDKLHVLVVTPMHNEVGNVAGVHDSLVRQVGVEIDWVVVDDGSSDGTGEALRGLAGHPAPRVVDKSNDGGLIGGSAYSSWRRGVEEGLKVHADCTHVMKLDADVRLPKDYFECLSRYTDTDVGLIGGVLVGKGNREQALHVPGPVKLYSRIGYDLLESLPSAIGFDVMDEVLLADEGLRTVVVRDARVEMSRGIGSSEGGVHGRFRNGRVCRWTGYDVVYFMLHALRYVGRKPYLVGSAAMVWGFVRAGKGPYPAGLRLRHGRAQRAKLLEASRRPVSWFRSTYRY